MPKISILTPTYNRAEFLPKLAESLQKQSFQDIEWIIGNDGSNDNSDEVIRSFAEIVQFPIIYINSSHRVGKSKIDNLLIDESKGEYILWCDSDDYFVDDALEFLLDEVKKFQNLKKNYTQEYLRKILILKEKVRHLVIMLFHKSLFMFCMIL